MSLLDDVSLMITPNGVAEDVLFGVLPQPIIGTEEITNGDFASDSNWSITNNTGTDSEITGGYLRIKTDGAYTDVTQTSVTVADKQYKLVYTISNSDGGNLGVVTQGNITSAIPSSVGTHTYYFTSHSTSFILKRRSGALDVKIDNVSVKEYTSADMDFTRATTATKVNSAGLVASVAIGIPRLDFTGGGCPHILAEPQRINLVTYSEDFSEWSTEGDIEVTDNFITSPDGTQNAAKLQLTGSSSGTDGKIKFTISPSATTHTFSVFAKKGNHDYIYIWVDISGGTNITRWIDLDDGSVSGSGGTATVTTTSFGNDFWKIEYTFDATNMSNIILEVADDGVSTGTGGDNIYVWGAQLEEGSYATSYIPTSGSTVTRNADVFTRTGIGSLINSAEGVLYVEIAALDDDQTGRKISLNDGTINN